MESVTRGSTTPTSARHGGSALRLWLYGLAMVVPAAAFALRYPLRGNTDQLLDIGKMAGYEREEFIWYCLGLGALFLLYALATYESRRLSPRQALPAVFTCGTLVTLAFAWMYPVNAIDIFIYAVRSRLWTEYGDNPNATLPLTYWNTDPYMHFGMREWADETSPYGPLWNLVAAPATLIGGDSIGVALAGFKVLAVICVLLGALAITQALAVIRPADAATGALVFLWNPLVQWEGVANAHNDVLLAMLLLMAALAWARRWNGLVIPMLLAAALIKYVSVLVIPLAVVGLFRRAGSWRNRARDAVATAAGSLLVLLIGFAPFYDVQAVIDSVERQGEFVGTSPAGVAISHLRDRFSEPGLTDTVKLIGIGIVLLTLGWQLADVWLKPRRLPRASFEVLFVFLLVATWWFRSWYLVWPVALVALLPVGLPYWRTLLWTAGGLGAYGVYIWIWDWWGAEWARVRDVGVLVTFAPVVALTLIDLARALLPRPRAAGHALERREQQSATSPS